MPHKQNPFFTGREDVLTALRANLQSGKATALTQAIQGLGGIGKTQTAVEYAYRHRDDYAAILWLSAATPESLAPGFTALARLLGLPEADAQDQSVTVAAVQRWLETNSGWLLILDNADDMALAQRILPSAPRGHVLITTRATALGGVAEPIRILKLDPEDGAAFLLRRARRLAPSAPLSAATEEDRATALELSRELGGLPLALDQAGAYIEEMPSTPRKYLAVYRDRRGELLKKRGSLGEAEHASVTTTFSLALETVERAHPASAELLGLCAFLAPDVIPEEILIEGAHHLGDILGPVLCDESARAAAIHWAYRWSLFEYDSDLETLSVHRLVQAVIQETMPTAVQRIWAERAVLAVNNAFPRIEFSSWPLCERLVAHAQLCAVHIEKYGIETAEAARLLNKAGYYLDDRGQYAAAEPLYEQALAIWEKALGPEHPDTATSLNNLAVLYENQGNFAASEPLKKRALAIQEKVLGPEHPSTAISLNNLAVLYENQGNFAASEPLKKRALAIQEKMLGPEHPSTAISLNNLAVLYENQGNFAASEPLKMRALAIKEKALGQEHPDTALSLNNLAALYDNQGYYAAAEPLYKRALAIKEKALGPEHPSTALGMENYALLLRKLGRNVEAKALEKRAEASRAAHKKKNERGGRG